MARTAQLRDSERGIRDLIAPFLALKLALLYLASASPGPGYDTSTELLFYQYSPLPAKSWLARTTEQVVLRLTRWDGIYFATLAERGHVNEQDWAFSWALSKATSFLSRVLLQPFPLSSIVKNALTGVLLSHVSHLLAVVVLYGITYQIVPSSKSKIAFMAATLHIFSQAGVFLSAPNSESAFALLNFTGTLAYVVAVQTRYSGNKSTAFWTVAAGACFGSAATIRGNGLLSGAIFAWDAIEAISNPRKLFRDLGAMGRILATGVAGLLVGIGFAAPQVVAYLEYCTAGNTRPWCGRIPPSIYSWVQEFYWEVGFLKYWTVNNLPLFLIAGPMLGFLLFTSFVAMRRSDQLFLACMQNPGQQEQASRNVAKTREVFVHVVRRLALPQLVLTVMAATSFHVQIINRISSGYPVWYIILAVAIHADHESAPPNAKKASSLVTDSNNGSGGSAERRKDLIPGKIGSMWHVDLLGGQYLQWTVRGMVMYAIVQAGLYASFLPPA